MEKFKMFLSISVSAICAFMMSCNSSKQITVKNYSDLTRATIYITDDNAKSLGVSYYSDPFWKNIHVFNSESVSFTTDRNGEKNDPTIDKNGAVIVNQEKIKTLGILRTETAGELDSVVRYSTRGIWKFKVKYLIENVGPCYVWYYHKTSIDKNTGERLSWYASNNVAYLTIDGIAVKRTTTDNRLKWSFQINSKTVEKRFNVISPFGATTVPVIKKPEIKKEAVKPPSEEVEEIRN